MKAIVKSEFGPGFKLTDVEEKNISSSTQVKIEILKSSVCGTDYHIYKWDDWASETINIGQINGHEVIAKVIEIGTNVLNVKIGDTVVLETHNYCGQCFQCQNGNAHICENMSIIGVNEDGIWCERQVVESNILWKIEEIDNKYAAIMEPLGNAIHTLSYSDVRGKHILITGAGPIGIMAAYCSLISGAATVSISEINEYRINMVKNMNLDINIINPISQNLTEELNRITKSQKIDVVLEMTGNVNAFNSAIKVIKPGGEINVLSVFSEEEAKIRLNDLVFKNIKVQFVTGRRLFQTWNVATNWLMFNKLKPEILDCVITHEFKMEEYEEVFKIMEKGECGKIVLDFTYLNNETI